MKGLDFIKVFLAAVFAAACAWAQDVIVMRDGKEVQAVVLEVGVDAIRYKKWDYQDGPFFVVNVSKVFGIKWRNGEKDVFEEKKETAATQQQLYFPVYVPQNATLVPAPAPAVAKPFDNTAGKGKRAWGHTLMWTGIALLGIGIPNTIVSDEAFASFIISGGTMLFTSIPLLASGYKDKAQANIRLAAIETKTGEKKFELAYKVNF